MANDKNNDGNKNAHNVLRVIQVLTLLPAWALLASLISDYNSTSDNSSAPGNIQFLFIICLLASIWSFCILIAVIRAGNTALWITFFDILGMALLIAGVVIVSDIANRGECVTGGVVPMDATTTKYYYDEDGIWRAYPNDGTVIPGNTNLRDGGWWIKSDDRCSKLKAAWGLAIANIVLFFVTAILAAVVYREKNTQVLRREKVYVEDPEMAPPPPMVAPVVYPQPVYEDPYARSEDDRRHSRRGSRSGHSRRSSHSHGHRSHRSRSRRGSTADYY